MKELILLGRRFLSRYFNVQPYKLNEDDIIEQIKQGVSFRGANAWVLIFAIFTASLGLNVNSTAVIIGAMLISPLMGPIIGMGLGIGIDDVELLKRSLYNYIVATVISVLTATVYFLISPLSEAQSELLARTSPTLYDILIALCGGAAGILAISTREKGNVIPGVAIATALMPPLCTAGFGIATGQWNFFFGAFYLFFINTIFISLATYAGVRLLHFRRINFVDAQRAENVQRYIWSVVIATILPAAYMTIGIVRDSMRENNMQNFVKEELTIDGTQILSSQIDNKTKLIQVVAIGREINKAQQDSATNQLAKYKLADYTLNLIQGSSTDSLNLKNTAKKRIDNLQEHLVAQDALLHTTEHSLERYIKVEEISSSIGKEVRVLFPQISEFGLSRTLISNTDSTQGKHWISAIITLHNKARMTDNDKAKIQEWLNAKCNSDSVRVFISE